MTSFDDLQLNHSDRSTICGISRGSESKHVEGKNTTKTSGKKLLEFRKMHQKLSCSQTILGWTSRNFSHFGTRDLTHPHLIWEYSGGSDHLKERWPGAVATGPEKNPDHQKRTKKADEAYWNLCRFDIHWYPLIILMIILIYLEAYGDFMTLRRSKEICRASRQESALTCCFGSGFGCPRLPMDSVQPGEAAKNAWDRQQRNRSIVHIQLVQRSKRSISHIIHGAGIYANIGGTIWLFNIAMENHHF